MNLYETLNLPRGANAQQIRDAYKTLVRTAHPDKGGNAEQFKKIQKAYDVLRDDSKRQYYDMTGEVPGESGDGGGGGGMSAGMQFPFPGGGIPVDIHNLFGMFGGGRGGGVGPKKKKQGKAPPRVSHIALNLRDFYHGRSFRMQLERQRFCKDCKGDGSTSMKQCEDCHGSGTKVSMVQIGPMVLQNQGPCDKCNGAGRQKGDQCWTCKGGGLSKEEKTLEIRVEPGMAPGMTIVFSGESSDSPDYTEPGDVVLELQEADEESPWQRLGDDLQTRITLSYSESICGTTVRISSHPGFDAGVVFRIPAGVLHTEQLRYKGYGMPRRGGKGTGDAILVIQSTKPSVAERDILEKGTLDQLRTTMSRESKIQSDKDHVVG